MLTNQPAGRRANHPTGRTDSSYQLKVGRPLNMRVPQGLAYVSGWRHQRKPAALPAVPGTVPHLRAVVVGTGHEYLTAEEHIARTYANWA